MLAVVSAEGARLDAGSVALELVRRWSDNGARVVLVDADTSGSRLARRFGEAVHADYSPAVRGLPSLIVAREPLTLRLLADHCYSLDTSKGSLWALFAPDNPAGAARAAGWLDERALELMEVDAVRSVIVSSSLRAGGEHLANLLRAAPVVVVLAPAGSIEQAKSLWTQCRDAGLMGFERRHRVLVVEGHSAPSDDEIGAEAGMHVAGRLPIVDDERVLRLQGGRRERAFSSSLDKIAGRLLILSNLDPASAGPASAEEAAPGHVLRVAEGRPRRSTVNGARAVPGRPATQVPEAEGGLDMADWPEGS